MDDEYLGFLECNADVLLLQSRELAMELIAVGSLIEVKTGLPLGSRCVTMLVMVPLVGGRGQLARVSVHFTIVHDVERGQNRSINTVKGGGNRRRSCGLLL